MRTAYTPERRVISGRIGDCTVGASRESRGYVEEVLFYTVCGQRD